MTPTPMTSADRTSPARPARWLVTGAGGKLGRDLLAVLGTDPGADVTALTRAKLDITDRDAVHKAVGDHDIVVNAAAWTDVDGAEAAEPAATAVNGAGVRYLAEACARSGARLLHVSTDYVFSGESGTPYPEDAVPRPVNAYGRSKLAGERAVAELLPHHGYVVRTGWLYGASGRDFPTTMLELAERHPAVDVVNDRQGQPTWAHAAAGQLAQLGRAALAGHAPPGSYHATASGRTTWFGFAQAVFELAGLDLGRVRPIASTAFQRPAARPACSVLAHGRWSAAGLAPLPDWRTSLADAFARGVFDAVGPAPRG
ncbi:dTDP-4-dehydrorhamnose reductase [Streptomyces sp. NPDC054933]